MLSYKEFTVFKPNYPPPHNNIINTLIKEGLNTMIYSNNSGIVTDRILTEVARFQPSASVPTSLKKTVISVCNNILKQI